MLSIVCVCVCVCVGSSTKLFPDSWEPTIASLRLLPMSLPPWHCTNTFQTSIKTPVYRSLYTCWWSINHIHLIHTTWLQLMLVIHMEIVKVCLVLYSPFPHDCKCMCTLMCYGNKVQKMCLQPKITVFFKVLWSSGILFAWNLLFMLQPSNIRIPNNTTSNRKSKRRVPWLYLLLKEKRRRAGVWFDPFKKIHTTPSESPCFLSLRRETASNAVWCAACWHEDELKNSLHFYFYNYH